MDMNSVSFLLSNIVAFYKWFVTHTFSLEEIDKAIELYEKKDQTLIKSVIVNE